MNVVHLNASNARGGAAQACMRLHLGLEALGVRSHMLDPTDAELSGDTHLWRQELIDRKYIWANRTDLTNTHFSVPLHGIDVAEHPLVEGSDVIHLHWLGSTQTPLTLGRLIDLGKPVVWTLHDAAPFTGGCHYSGGCTGFKRACSGCPQLEHDPFDLPAAALRDKLELIDPSSVTLVAPSSWIAEQARASVLFGRGTSINVIPYGVDTSLFRPCARAEARAALGVPEEGTMVLCGADQGSEKRKGLAALPRVLADARNHPALGGREFGVLWIGDVPADVLLSGLPITSFGRVLDDERMALAYAAADVFVFPSLEDNLPNMLLESLSCGTPAVAFAIGGVPEIVEDGANGLVSDPGNERAMADAIATLLTDARLRQRLGARGRATATESFSLALQARRYMTLYETLLARPRVAVAKRAAAASGPGPAVSALLAPLSIHSLKAEAAELRQQTRAAEEAAECLRGVGELLRLSEDDRAAKQEVIVELKDHWERAEAAAAERLELLEALSARPRLRLLGALRVVRQSVRLDNWWSSKIPPLLAVAYLLIALGRLRPGSVAPVLAAMFLSISCVAAYGHVINDIFDIESDRIAGKTNSMARYGPLWRMSLAAATAAAAFVPALFVSYSAASITLLAANLALPTLYSVPPVRLKERGVLALIADVGGSHLVPTAFLLATLGPRLDVGRRSEVVFGVAAVGWSCALGVKGILHHQISDRENDIASSTTTFVTVRRAEDLQTWLSRYNLLIETPVSAVLAFTVLDACPLAAVAFLAYFAIETAKYVLGFQFALTSDPRTIRASFPFVNEAFYVFWLPLAAAAQLAMNDLRWLSLVAAQSALLGPTLARYGRDLRDVGRAGKDAGIRRWRALLHGSA